MYKRYTLRTGRTTDKTSARTESSRHPFTLNKERTGHGSILPFIGDTQVYAHHEAARGIRTQCSPRSEREKKDRAATLSAVPILKLCFSSTLSDFSPSRTRASPCYIPIPIPGNRSRTACIVLYCRISRRSLPSTAGSTDATACESAYRATHARQQGQHATAPSPMTCRARPPK